MVSEKPISSADTSVSPIRIGHYNDNGDGTVIDIYTGLIWMRCARGQTWDGKNCQGEARVYTWDEAMKLRHTFAGHDDWRLPNIDELKTIIDKSQGNPTIDSAAFPNTPLTSFWSTSPSAGGSNDAWGVTFYGGVAYSDKIGNSFGVRFVRDGKCLNPLKMGLVAEGQGPVIAKKSGTAQTPMPAESAKAASTHVPKDAIEFPRIVATLDTVEKAMKPSLESNTKSSWMYEERLKSSAAQATATSSALHGMPVGPARTAALQRELESYKQMQSKVGPGHYEAQIKQIADALKAEEAEFIRSAKLQQYWEDMLAASASMSKAASESKKAVTAGPIYPSIRIGHFIDTGNGTVTDTRSGLMWMRCAMGQTWDGKTCQGEAQNYFWSEAKKLCYSFAGHQDWRLPDIEELKTIIDTSQGFPTIDQRAFPNTPLANFWSFPTDPNDSYDTYYLNFGYSEINDYGRGYRFNARLVRGGQRYGSLVEERRLQPSPPKALHIDTPHSSNATESLVKIPAVPADSVWIPQGQSVEKGGYSIPGGLIYVGRGLEAVNGWDMEPALIDLSLKIERSTPDRTGSNMDYWPSFAKISPTSRAAYLEWLATGRKDPNAYIGYVFLYFYGLERRALADAPISSMARSEIGAILVEAKRLLAIYGGNYSFRGYASSFIDILQSFDEIGRPYKIPPAYSLPCFEIPLSIKVALGQMAVDGVPLSAAWAFAWLETDPMISLRTPAQRCQNEFKKLFQIRYTEKFGKGYKLKLNKTKIRIHYSPASASFGIDGDRITMPVNNLPDVTVLKEPISTLRQLAESCTNELDAYSRYLGRNAGAEDFLAATALLPQALLNEHGGKEFQDLSAWLTGLMAAAISIPVGLDKLLQRIPSVNRESFGKREATALAQLLAKVGVGMEPDARFGNLLPKPGQEVILFKVSGSAPSTPSKEYSAATILMHLATAVANADGSIAPEEERHLEEHLEAWLHLSPDEKVRLKNHTQWLFTTFPGLSGIKKRLEMLATHQKESIGKFLVSVAQADGHIDPTEIKILTKIYELLGLDAQNLYSHAHAAAVEPVAVQAADMVRQGYAIPRPLAVKPTAGIVLDMSSVEAKLAETVAVSALLNTIFTDDESVVVKNPPALPPTRALPNHTGGGDLLMPVQESTDSAAIPGLDVELSAFMRQLAAKLVWARAELEHLAAEQSLMLDGTLDSINDASFDLFGGLFCEGDDPIEINAEIAKEIVA